jgi:hypothetical protein
VKISVSFKSICIQFALVLSFLLALSPFLHAHYGASKIAGFHMAGINSVTVTSEPAFAMTSFSQDEEQESAALGVEASYSRQISLDVEDQPESFLILTFFVMSVLSLQVVSFLLMQDTHSSVSPPFSQGFPPLPHAPPTFRS